MYWVAASRCPKLSLVLSIKKSQSPNCAVLVFSLVADRMGPPETLSLPLSPISVTSKRPICSDLGVVMVVVRPLSEGTFVKSTT